jgi:tRNA(fMet)-specific endonuclease VapC
MVCLDTTFLVDLIRRNPSAEKKLQYFRDGGEPLTTTAISAAELFEGAYSTKAKRGDLEQVKSTLEHMELLELSLAVCERYGKLANELGSRGLPIGDLDVIIASAAIVHRQILLTKNKKHFDRIPELVAESW